MSGTRKAATSQQAELIDSLFSGVNGTPNKSPDDRTANGSNQKKAGKPKFKPGVLMKKKYNRTKNFPNQQGSTQNFQDSRQFPPSTSFNSAQSSRQFANSSQQSHEQADQFTRSQSIPPKKEKFENAKRAQTPSASSHYGADSKRGSHMERDQTPSAISHYSADSKRGSQMERDQTPSASSHYGADSKREKQMERGRTPSHYETASAVDRERPRDEQSLSRDPRLNRGKTPCNDNRYREAQTPGRSNQMDRGKTPFNDNRYQETQTPRRSDQIENEQASYYGYQGAKTPRRSDQMESEQALYCGYQGEKTPRRDSQMDYEQTSYNSNQRVKTPARSSHMDCEQPFHQYVEMENRMKSEQTPSRDVNYRKGLTNTYHAKALFTGENNYHQESMTNRAKTPSENNNHGTMPKIKIQLNRSKTPFDSSHKVDDESKWQRSNFVEIENGSRREKSVFKQEPENPQDIQGRNRFQNDAKLNQPNNFYKQILDEICKARLECDSWKKNYYEAMKQIDDLKSVPSNQATDYNFALENKYNELTNTMNQTVVAKNCEIANLKEELQTQKDDFNAIQKKHDDLKKMYSQVYADANRFHQERAKLRNDLKEQKTSFGNLEREFNSMKTENFKLQLEIYKLKLEQSLNGSTQARPNNSTVNGDSSTQSHSSNGVQVSNASSANQQRQTRPFTMPKQVKQEVIEGVDQKAATYPNQPLTKPLQNGNQSLVMNRVSAANASSNVNGQEEKKFVTGFEAMLPGFNPPFVPYVSGSVPSAAANSSKRKGDGIPEDNAQSSKRPKL